MKVGGEREWNEFLIRVWGVSLNVEGKPDTPADVGIGNLVGSIHAGPAFDCQIDEPDARWHSFFRIIARRRQD